MLIDTMKVLWQLWQQLGSVQLVLLCIEPNISYNSDKIVLIDDVSCMQLIVSIQYKIIELFLFSRKMSLKLRTENLNDPLVHDLSNTDAWLYISFYIS